MKNVTIGFSCRDVAEHASDHLEGALPWPARARLMVHLAMCRHCRRLVRQLRAVTGALGLLAEPDAPHTRPATSRRGAVRMPALAGAALATAAALAVLLVPTFTLQREVYAHALDGHAQPGAPVAATEVTAVLARLGADLADPLPGVVYANPCEVGGRPAAHLLVAADNAPPATVLVVPQRARDSRFSRGDMHGVLVRVGSGTVAVLADTPQRAEVVTAALRTALRWDSGRAL